MVQEGDEIGDVERAWATAKQLGLDYVDLGQDGLDRDAALLVDRRVLLRHGVLPLRVEDGRLLVAMSDPKNFYAVEDLTMISGYQITPVVAPEADIRRTLDKVFARGEDVSGLLEDASEGLAEDDPSEVELVGDVTDDNAPVVRLVGSILQRAVGEDASDIHVEPRAGELKVRFRVDGVLREVMTLPQRFQSGIVARLKVLGGLDIAERRLPQDGRFSARLGEHRTDLRVATLPTVFGEKVVLRLLDAVSAQADLSLLGFAPEALDGYRTIFRRPYGTILVTGPTGSGKSTTLYATLAELNEPETNIITVEDPVESRMVGVNQVQINPRVGLSFASGLRSILRADPDVVMIGEIRDKETAKISVEAALTGHLVLATLHTNKAPAAITRLTDMGVEPFLTASAVDCVIAQRLARRLCEWCRRPANIGEGALEAIGFSPLHVAGRGPGFQMAVGCDRCSGTGYRGRIGVYELMEMNEEIRELVLRRVSTDEIGRAAERGGMTRLREDGLAKAAQGITTIEEVLRNVV
ncbi:MAG: GspE/PulE family protein [Rubrobacter sp.]